MLVTNTLLFIDKNIDDAFKNAEKFRKLLNIDVLDATTSEKKWIEAV